MTSKAPPVPPQNQSPKGTGDRKDPVADQTLPGQAHGENADQKGQQASIKQNTTHQGNQQDR
jgi:hypothetical protein